MDSDSTAVGQRIRAARDAVGLTQQQLADAVGVKQQSVTKWEGGGEITNANLVALARTLRVSVDHLLGNEAPTLQMAASGVDLDELRVLDPAGYQRIVDAATKALDKAKGRRRR